MGNANGRDVGFQAETWAADAATVGSLNFLSSIIGRAFIGSAEDGRP